MNAAKDVRGWATEQLCAEIRARVTEGKSHPRDTAHDELILGDCLLALSQRDPAAYSRLVDELGLRPQFVTQRRWVSKQVPLDSPIRNIRGLTFTHLRGLAALPDRDELAQTFRGSTRHLIAHIERKCAACGKRVPMSDETVLVTIGKERRRVFCGVTCARDFLDTLSGAVAARGGGRHG